MSSKRGKKRQYGETTHNKNSDETNVNKNGSSNEKNEELLKELQQMRDLYAEMDNNFNLQHDKLDKISLKKNHTQQSAGIHCVKFGDNEYIFDFVVYDEDEPVVYTVQFFNCNNKGELGNLNLPLGTDIQRILAETPLDNLTQASKFLKNCKRYIDFYHERKKQFKELESYIHSSVNCFFTKNFNYTTANLQLMNVYNPKTNIRIHINIYLLYDSVESKPKKIKVDSSDRKESNDTTLDDFIEFSECFKSMTLKEALTKLSNENSETIQWEIEFYDDNLTYPSDSTDESISNDENSSQNKKSTTKDLKKHKTRRKQNKKQSTDQVSVGTNNLHPNSQKKSVTFKKSRRGKVQEQNSKANKTPLKQTKLSFITEKSISSEQKENPEEHIKERLRAKVGEKRKSPSKMLATSTPQTQSKSILKQAMKGKFKTLPTSTPLQTQSKSNLKQAMRENLDISDISKNGSMPPPNQKHVKKTKQDTKVQKKKIKK